MKKEDIKISGIPAILWGESAEKLIIAVHGNMSHKSDVPIEMLSKNALQKGYQVLSFDLPEHGDRKDEGTLCKVQNCIVELGAVLQYAKDKWQHLSFFGNSLGAYFGLLAYKDVSLKKAWFLSPVVDMERIIGNMMKWFSVTEEQLRDRQTISTPIGQTLYWDYYCYVKEHPVSDWKTPTCILYGSKDVLCERDAVTSFAEKFSCQLEIVEDGEHYFHTPEQLEELDEWLGRAI